MGAIFGFVGYQDEELLHAMADRLQHRGSVKRTWSKGHLSVGMWLDGGSQNLPANDNSVLVADLDIYNSDVLYKKLTAQGYSCQTSDPNAVVHTGFRAVGPRFCSQLDGDFSLALWDRERSTLLIARDPLGSRPLFYWKNDDVFAFASEYKALLALPFVPAEVKLEAVQQLQYTKYPPANGTLLEGIFSLPPGHYATVHEGTLHTEGYWRVDLDIKDEPETYHVHKLREQFLAAVRQQVGDAREIGTTLSGGVDSAAIVAAIRTVKPDLTIHTFTCGYGPDDPEVRSAEIVAGAVGSKHHNIFVKPSDLPSILPSLVWHLEDPIARTETVLNFETARYASGYVDTVLAGHAGDGLYGGMPRHKLIRLMQWLPPLRKPIWEFYNYTQCSALPESVLGRTLHHLYYRGSSISPPKIRGVALSPAPVSIPPAGKELLNRVLIGGVNGGIAKWLPKVDRTHMAHGLRYRSPFVEKKLVRRAFQVPDGLKIRYWREKHIFREAVKPLLPPEVLNRPKFPQAMQYDLELSQVLEELSYEFLSEERVRERGFFCPDEVERLRSRPKKEAYSSEQSMRLWTAILTELWAQIYLDNRGHYPRFGRNT